MEFFCSQVQANHFGFRRRLRRESGGKTAALHMAPSPRSAEVFILKLLKVICFHTLLQVLILKSFHIGQNQMRIARLIMSDVTGVGLVIAGFHFSFLNWLVDGPGWVVSRFTSIDFHEGEGAFGFFFALFLAWFSLSAMVWLAIHGVQRIAQRTRKGA